MLSFETARDVRTVDVESEVEHSNRTADATASSGFFLPTKRESADEANVPEGVWSTEATQALLFFLIKIAMKDFDADFLYFCNCLSLVSTLWTKLIWI
jgi:hypothetical protein